MPTPLAHAVLVTLVVLASCADRPDPVSPTPSQPAAQPEEAAPPEPTEETSMDEPAPALAELGLPPKFVHPTSPRPSITWATRSISA